MRPHLGPRKYVLLILLMLKFSVGCAQFSFPLSQLYITSPYGPRIHPLTRSENFHSGIDLRASYAPVSAILSGRVKETGENAILGKYIKIIHGEIESISGHLSKIMVKPREYVTGGQNIGISGNSGRSTGPHLHFAIKVAGTLTDPVAVMRILHNFNQHYPMENNQYQQQDELPLAAVLMLLRTQNQISLSLKQAQEYGVEYADQMPQEEQEGQDGN